MKVYELTISLYNCGLLSFNMFFVMDYAQGLLVLVVTFWGHVHYRGMLTFMYQLTCYSWVEYNY